MRLLVGEVFDAIAVGLYVEEFLARTFTEVVLPEFIIACASLVEQQRLDGAGIAVEVTSLGIARRPASGLKIV